MDVLGQVAGERQPLGAERPGAPVPETHRQLVGARRDGHREGAVGGDLSRGGATTDRAERDDRALVRQRTEGVPHR